MIKNYFKIGWRNLKRNKAFTAINVFGLTLGITACLVIYLVTSFQLSYDNFHPDKERIYRVVCDIHSKFGKDIHISTVPDPVGKAIKDEMAGLETITIFRNYYSSVTIPVKGGDSKKFYAPNPREEMSEMIIADKEYFDIFQANWLAGNKTTALVDPFKVVLTKSKADKYFGERPSEEIVGKTIFYNDSLRLEVSGVIEDFSANSDFAFKDFISFSTVERSFLKNDFTYDQWGNFNSDGQVFVKLAKGTTISKINNVFANFSKHPIVGEGEKAIVKLQPLSDIHFNEIYKDSYSSKASTRTLYGLMAIAAFILAIASINFINLSTAQSIQRSKEVGIRKVLGSNRKSVVLQFLCETFLLTLFAVVISLLILNPILFSLEMLIPKVVTIDLLNFNTIAFLVLITIATSLLAGLYPAKVLSSYLPAVTLKGNPVQNGNNRGFFRKGLIIFQFSISLIFIIATLAIGNQIRFFLNKDMGFAKEAIINISTSWNHPPEKKELLAEAIRKIPEVSMVSLSEGTPAAQGHWGTTLKYIGKSEIEVESELQFCDEKFLPLYQLTLLAGRNLYPSDTMKEILINETCAKALGFIKAEEAIGKILVSGISDTKSQKKCAIVGVVADFHSKSLHEKINPTFITTSKAVTRLVSLKLSPTAGSTNQFSKTISKVEKLWKEVYPNEKFEYNFFDQRIAKFYEGEQKTAQIIQMAMFVAIFISCMGLFGLATYTAHKRTKEIGIRKVLGASIPMIIAMISSEFLFLILISILIASPIAWYFIHQWLQNFAYRIDISIWLFLIAGFATILIALATVSYQAIRAALSNPVKSLRAE
jgi:putative ABC transport system permease protein